jgi:uncharacterized membrane protein SpoIIM required for sporulation
MVKPSARGAGTEETGRRAARWQRLASLVQMAEARGLAQLDDGQVWSLSTHYRALMTHLALARSMGAPARELQELNGLATRCHALIYGRSAGASQRYLWWWSLLAFPSTVRRTLAYHALALALLALGGLYGYLGAARNPEWALEMVMSGDERTPYASRAELLASLRQGQPLERQPGATSEEEPRVAGLGEKSVFAALLWQNNTKVALISFFSGLLAGLPTALLVARNGSLLGTYSRLFHDQGLALEWWAWILPHGVTELLALVLLAGGGLWIGRIMLLPGRTSRREAFRDARGDLFRLALFAFLMLLLAALFESFVRQSGLSDPARYVFAGVTALAWAAYFGLVRSPTRAARRILAARSVAERAVPLPDERDFRRLAR